MVGRNVRGRKSHLSAPSTEPSQADLVDTVDHFPDLATDFFAHAARGKTFCSSRWSESSSARPDIVLAVHDGAPEVTGVTFTAGDGKPTETSEIPTTPTEVARVTFSIEPTETSKASATPTEVTRVTISLEPTETSHSSTSLIDVTHVTLSINPTGTSEVVTTETKTETEPCGGEETTTFHISPTSTGPASTPATKTETETETVSCSTPCSVTATRITFTLNPTSTARETETVSCSSSSPCHTKETTSTGFGFTISLTNAVTNTKATTSSGVPVTITVHPYGSTGSTLTTKPSSTPGGKGPSTKVTVDSTTVGTATSTLKIGTTVVGTATATTAFNSAQKLEGFNKLIAASLFLLVCKFLL